MFKKLLSLLLALALCAGLTAALAEDYNPAELLDWYEEHPEIWMTVNNDHWDARPESAPTDEEIEKMLTFALKSQTGIHWTETFFIVVRDVETQRGIIGQSFGTLEGSANEGTVTILVLTDNILPQEQHATPYDGSAYFQQPTMASFNSGLTCGMLNVAATTLGYSTHYFAYPDGTLIKGTEHDLSYFLEGNDYTRVWGITGSYEDASQAMEIPVEGNMFLQAAVVIGKPNPDEDIHTTSTMHARPDNFVFWGE